MPEVKNLTKSFGEKRVFNNLSMSLPDAGVVLITGASGSGKTTLLKIMSGLERPDSGAVEGLTGRKISVVFQDDRLLPWLTAMQNICVVNDVEDCDIDLLLSSVGLKKDEADKFPYQLSGGQRRRVAFLRGVNFLRGEQNGVLLLDEPFNGLDLVAAGMVCRVVESLPTDFLTVIVSHQTAPLDGMDISFFSLDDYFGAS